MLSVHTSPLEQPGTGDAGGLNVYVSETARRMARRGIEVDVFTRATSSDLPPAVELAPGVLVRHVPAGPLEGLRKHDLVGQLCAFTAGLVRFGARHELGHYDLVHSHYWLAGQVGWLVADRWDVPLVHTMHTMAKVKNAALADGDVPEPQGRVIGEEQVVAAAGRLIANTEEEARDLVTLYGADPAQVAIAPPGVDLEVFSPGGPCGRRSARRRLGLPDDVQLLLFVGRIQPLKAPDVVVRAVARLVTQDPSRRGRLMLAVLGGSSGGDTDWLGELRAMTAGLGVADVVRFEPPVARRELARWYRAADLVVVPSHNESFGLVAAEAQACGTPVVATRVGGLRTAVADGSTGLLVDGHDPGRWARALATLLDHPARRAQMQVEAVARAGRFSWERTVDVSVGVYSAAVRSRRCRPVRPVARAACLDPTGPLTGGYGAVAVAP